jgi:hypothetical protein
MKTAYKPKHPATQRAAMKSANDSSLMESCLQTKLPQPKIAKAYKEVIETILRSSIGRNAAWESTAP